MTAKEFLKQYEYANQRARRLREMYETEQEKIDAIGSTLSSDGLPHGSGVSRKTEDKAIRLSEAAAKWKAAEIDALMARAEVFEFVHDIPGVEGELLFERYINLRTWEEVSDTIHLSWSGTHKAHKRALAIVQKRLSE